MLRDKTACYRSASNIHAERKLNYSPDTDYRTSHNTILPQKMPNLDPEADQSKRDVIRDIKARILAYQLLKLLR